MKLLSSRVKIVAIIFIASAIGYAFGIHGAPAGTTATQSVAVVPAKGSVRVIYSLDKKQNDRELVSVIDNAKKYVYFAIYEFTLDDVADALVRAKERGVDVRGIMDKKNSLTSYETGIVAKLKSAGIPLETQTHPDGIMHIKALVTENAYASGSYNWTYSATNVNDEVLEIGTDSGLRETYEALIKKLLADNSDAVRTTQGAGRATGTVNYINAQKYIGQYATVSGTIIAVYTSHSGTTFFDYCASYGDCPFSAVVFAGDRKNLVRYSATKDRKL